MSNQNNNSVLSLSSHCYISVTQRIITMPILLIFVLPSLVCFFIIFYYLTLLYKPMLMNSINHHIILLILISDFLLIATELPFSLLYLGLGYAPTAKLCTFWIYWDYILETTSLFLTMHAAIERYLLVFHKNFLLKRKILFHFMPMLVVTLYIPILYMYLVIFSPCVHDHQYDLTAFVCGGSCFFGDTFVNTYDTIVDTMLPCFIMIIFNILLIIRVVSVKQRAHISSSISNTLNRNRRMILQLMAINLMCSIAWMPWVVIIIAQNFFDPSFGTWFITYILHYLPYLTASVSPFLALIGLPDIRKRIELSRKHIVTVPNSTTTHQQNVIAIISENRNEQTTVNYELKTIV